MTRRVVREALRPNRDMNTALQMPGWLGLDPVSPNALAARFLPHIEQMLRMVGYLLEHHGTARTEARNGTGMTEPYDSPWACQWCLLGATKAVARVMRWNSGDLWLAVNLWLFGELRLPSGAVGSIQIWDDNGVRGVPGWHRGLLVERLEECQ